MARGSLVVVGTGIKAAGHLTVEAVWLIQSSERVLYVVTDLFAERMLWNLNPLAMESLVVMYGEGKPRKQTYRQQVDRIIECVRSGLRTCVVGYGHPGVFAPPAHEAIRIAKSEGYFTRLLPAVSADDCMIADLGIDPANHGWQTFEATNFLKDGRRPDPTCYVQLWQIGVLGQFTYSTERFDLESPLQVLVDYLGGFYPPEHEVILYLSSTEVGPPPAIVRTPLAKLAHTSFPTLATMCIPPAESSQPNAEMHRRLGIEPSHSGIYPQKNEPLL